MSLQLAWLECIGGLFSMNSILQLVDRLRPDELMWLHTYLACLDASDPPSDVWSANGCYRDDEPSPEGACSGWADRTTAGNDSGSKSKGDAL